MERLTLEPRDNWQMKVESHGLTYHSPSAMEPRPYWDESAAYHFSSAEIDTLEAAGNQLQTMCLAAAQHVIDKQRYAELAIPPDAIPLIEWAWEQEPPAVYGRFDIAWAGAQSGEAPKLLEYNADTPTSLIEAAVIQWEWMTEMGLHLPHTHILRKPDQFNSIHDRLIAKWKDVKNYLKEPVYFAALEFDDPDPQIAKEAAEDLLTVTYLRDTAAQAGLQTRHIPLQEIGWNPDRHCFVDTDFDENQMQTIFKLYPWEQMLSEEFGPAALATYRQMTWIEPIWKLLLSNKGILPILWELYPNHELLLPAFFERAEDHAVSSFTRLSAYVRKPLFSREGANVSIVRPNAQTVETPGPYGAGPFIRQGIAPALAGSTHFLNAQDEPRYPVLGLWMVDQDCSGLGIRESGGPITDNLSSFIPHYFS